MIECKICNKQYKNLNSLKVHITRMHKLTYKAYITNQKIVRLCKFCDVDISHLPINSVICKSEICHKKRRLEYNYKHSRLLTEEKYKDKDEYIDYVVCKICGLKSSSLVSHITRNHKISVGDYKSKFNTDDSSIYSVKYKEGLSERSSGTNNGAFGHGGRYSPYSKKFIKYEGMTDKEKDLKINSLHKQQGESLKGNNHICPRYWMKRGYTKEQSINITKNRQTTFSLEKCIEKYGEDEGFVIWKERQQKWQKTLKNKTPEEIKEINRKKGLDRNGKHHLGSINEKLFIYKPEIKGKPCFLYYLRFYGKDMVFWKIGITTNTVEERFSGCGIKYEIIKLFKTTLYDAFKKEQEILRENKEFRICVKYKGFKTTEAFAKDIWLSL